MATAGEAITAKTICLAIKLSTFGNSKQAPLSAVQVDADKTLLRLSKQLLDSPELVAIQRHDRATIGRIRNIAFPSLFKGGVYLIPMGLVTLAVEILKEASEQRALLVEAAVQAYPLRVQETSERLGVTASPADYPSKERFKAAFQMDWQLVTFETPTKLKAISAALFEAEAEKQRSKLESVAGECQQAMRAALSTLVQTLTDKLTPTEDGKAKRLNASAIENINDFLSMFELKNVTNDDELAEIVQQARAVMKGVDPKMLKSDELVRQKLLDELAQVRSALDPLVIEHNRAISFEDD